MICSHCQRDIADYSNYCSWCGARQEASVAGPTPAAKRFMRSSTDCKIAGVCGGVAEYFGIDSTLVRLGWVLAVLLPIPLVPATLGYIVAWIVMPKAPLPSTAPAQQPPVVIPNSTQTA